MLLITGTGRCGTGYIAKLLTIAGADVRHEHVGRDGMSDWHIVGYVAKLLAHEDIPRDTRSRWHIDNDTSALDGHELKVVHQVRAPLPTIGSLQTMGKISVEHVLHSLQLPQERIKMCMTWYVEWNRLAEESSMFTYQVENIGPVWDRLCIYAGIEPGTPIPALAGNVNSRRKSYEPVTWELLEGLDKDLADQVWQLAERYGYER